MRFPVLLGTGAMTAGMLLLGGLVATELNPVPVVNVDAMELDGASVLATPMPQVSPRPHLMIRVSRPLNPGDWHLELDGRTVDVAIRSSGAVLRVALPGPLQLSSHHTLELVAGAIRVRAAFQVVPPLNAEINLHLYRLQIDAQPRVAATIQFSRAVASRQQAQTRVTVSGQPTFTWRDSRTLDVVSTGFMLADPARRAALARNLVNEAKTYGYAGFQLDFEQIPWTDRDLLTALVQDCANAFHPAGLNLSIAVIPRVPGDDTSSGSLLDYFHQWSGAYDFAGLAKAADFLSFMTYDEHNGVTPAGAVSGTPWIRRALEFSMQGVPPEKATLGLPTYYHDWTGVGYLTSSSYADALILAQRYGAAPSFDATEEEMHFGYDAYGVHHELWIQSTDTLRRKLPLMYEYGLKGISVWRLGFEDHSFWNLIPPRR